MNFKYSAVFLTLFLASPHSLFAEEVRVSDIGGPITLIGRLGKPVGSVVTSIEGRLISDPKQGKSGQITAALRVSKVDGKALDKTEIVGLIFRASEGMPNFHADDVITFSGYESGAFIGTPEPAREALGKDASALDWKFESTIHVMKVF